MKSRQTLTIVAGILFLLLLCLLFWAIKTNQEKNDLQVENDTLNSEFTALKSLKEDLIADLDSLQNAYENLAVENGDLQSAAAAAEERVAQTDAQLRRLKNQVATESKNLKTQIEELLAAKSNLEFSINNLQSENDSLRATMGILTADLATSKSENEALITLNATIQDELKKLTLANFKASAFRVEVEGRRPKATAKSRRAKRLLVSFDLMNVVPKYRGLRTLYLVITDDKGTPIKMSNPIQTTVNVNGQEMDILAAKELEVNIEENQRLSFNYDLEDKLRSGYYRVAVYTDVGLLGASSFRLG